jgi:hypothetical protein
MARQFTAVMQASGDGGKIFNASRNIVGLLFKDRSTFIPWLRAHQTLFLRIGMSAARVASGRPRPCWRLLSSSTSRWLL